MRGLGQNQITVLKLLREESLHRAEIARRTKIEVSNVRRILRTLLDRGLIEEFETPPERRYIPYGITQEGIRTLEQMKTKKEEKMKKNEINYKAIEAWLQFTSGPGNRNLEVCVSGVTPNLVFRSGSYVFEAVNLEESMKEVSKYALDWLHNEYENCTERAEFISNTFGGIE